ncbi:MAG: DUF2807 domain-containing protein [Pseudoflavonifractor sp.]|nr:DUF2807 domain-containing protein [Pseudoflavonifractor sp.]
MRQPFITSILALAALTATAAEPTRYELNIGDFSELKVIEGLNVDYYCSADSAGKAVFTTSPDLASILMFTNDKGKLEMQISTDGIEYDDLPTIKVYSNFLTNVENSGDSTVRVITVAGGPQFKAKLIGNGRLVVRDIHATTVNASLSTGNGTLVISGNCDRAKIGMTGSGTVQADELKAPKVKCTLLGTGSVGCWPTDHLTVIGATSGKVYYRGEPSVIKNTSIGIKTVKIDG